MSPYSIDLNKSVWKLKIDNVRNLKKNRKRKYIPYGSVKPTVILCVSARARIRLSPPPPFTHFENRAKNNAVWLTSSSRLYSVKSIQVHCFARSTTYACDYADNVCIYIDRIRFKNMYTLRAAIHCKTAGLVPALRLTTPETAFARVPIYYFVYTCLPICNVSFYGGTRGAVIRLKRSCARVPGRDRSRPRVQQNALERCFIFDRFPFFPGAVYRVP